MCLIYVCGTFQPTDAEFPVFSAHVTLPKPKDKAGHEESHNTERVKWPRVVSDCKGTKLKVGSERNFAKHINTRTLNDTLKGPANHWRIQSAAWKTPASKWKWKSRRWLRRSGAGCIAVSTYGRVHKSHPGNSVGTPSPSLLIWVRVQGLTQKKRPPYMVLHMVNSFKVRGNWNT